MLANRLRCRPNNKPFGYAWRGQYCIRLPANTRRCTNVGLMLAHRLRRWLNINPTLVQRLEFVGLGGHHAISRGGGGWIFFEINNFARTLREINNLLQ